MAMNRFLLSFLFCMLLAAHQLFAETYVVVVGISDYKYINDLRLPESDAKAIAKLYRTKTDNVILITGKYATRDRMLSALKSQFSRAGSSDEIVFSFSGHGFQGGICPYDIQGEQGGISYNDILKIFKQSSAKKKIIFADACFSGSLRVSGKPTGQVVKKADVLLFLSSRDGETSIESAFMANGFFTTYLLRGLRGNADRNRDRRITARELFDFVSSGVRKKSKDKQHPVMWGRFNDDFVVMQW